MPMSIGVAAAAAGVNVQTLRYYERRGILDAPPRTEAGYRQYDAATVDRLLFIKRAQELGFTLGEIQELLSLRIEHAAACSDVETKARAKLAQVEQKIRGLQRLRDALEGLVGACERRQPTQECPILETLESH